MKISDTATKKNESQIKMLTRELINQYHYLSFLVNNREIKDQHAYRLGNKFILRFFDSFSKKKLINKEHYEDIYIMVNRWKNHPPDKLKNRVFNWLMGR
jgi:hypothetical protein